MKYRYQLYEIQYYSVPYVETSNDIEYHVKSRQPKDAPWLMHTDCEVKSEFFHKVDRSSALRPWKIAPGAAFLNITVNNEVRLHTTDIIGGIVIALVVLTVTRGQ